MSEEQEKFLAELPSEGDPVVKEEVPAEGKQEGKETPSASPTDQKTKEQKPSQDVKPEEVLPFHKHPRWKALQEEKKQQQQLIETMQSKLSQLEQSRTAAPEAVQLPPWFIQIYGENRELYDQMVKQEEERRSAIKEEVFKEMEARQQAQEANKGKWDKWVDTQIGLLEEDDLVFDKNELLAVMNQYTPTDGQGNLDFRKGYELLQLKNSSVKATDKVVVDAKKNVAGKTAPSRGATPLQQGIPINVLRRKTIHDLANEPL